MGVAIPFLAIIAGVLWSLHHKIEEQAQYNMLMSVAREVQIIAQNYSSFDELPGIDDDAAAGVAGEKISYLRTVSDVKFEIASVYTSGPSFTLRVEGLRVKNCKRLLREYYGSYASVSASVTAHSCEAGELEIMFTPPL